MIRHQLTSDCGLRVNKFYESHGFWRLVRETRVRPITYRIPKPMIPHLAKKPVMVLLELLRQRRFEL